MALAPSRLSCPTCQWLRSLGTEHPVTEVTERSLRVTTPGQSPRPWPPDGPEQGSGRHVCKDSRNLV